MGLSLKIICYHPPVHRPNYTWDTQNCGKERRAKSEQQKE